MTIAEGRYLLNTFDEIDFVLASIITGTQLLFRKRPAAAMSNQPPKKVSAIANRRVELLEQLKVVENAILKKRAKLT